MYKTESFKNHTRSKTLNHYICSKEEILNIALELIDNETFNEDLRLIGLSVSSFKETEIEQLRLI